MMRLFKIGDFVRYDVADIGVEVEAIVRHTHRDRTATVEARHVFRDGQREGGYLGFLYRVNNAQLRIA